MICFEWFCVVWVSGIWLPLAETWVVSFPGDLMQYVNFGYFCFGFGVCGRFVYFLFCVFDLGVCGIWATCVMFGIMICFVLGFVLADLLFR